MAKKKITSKQTVTRVKNQLSDEVAALYQLKNWKGGTRQDFGRFGIVDLSTMTVKSAARLVSMGFPKLVPTKQQ